MLLALLIEHLWPQDIPENQGHTIVLWVQDEMTLYVPWLKFPVLITCLKVELQE